MRRGVGVALTFPFVYRSAATAVDSSFIAEGETQGMNATWENLLGNGAIAPTQP